MGDTMRARPGRTYPLAHTRRSIPHPDGPLGHAGTSIHTGRTRRSSFSALCGAAIGPVPGGAFDPHHKRACPACARAVEEADRG